MSRRRRRRDISAARPNVGAAGLNVSLIHLVRRDYVRAEISHYLLNHKEAKCLPQDAMMTLFAKALHRHGEVNRFSQMVAKLPARAGAEVKLHTP